MMLDAEHDLPVHLDKATIAVIGKALVAALPRQPLDRAIVEAEVEHGIHHAGHRDAGARAHRNQKRIIGIAKPRAERLLDRGEPGGDLFFEIGRIGLAVIVKPGADLGRDRKARRHRQSEIAHFGQTGAFAAEQVAHLRPALGGCRRQIRRPISSCAAHPSICEKSATWFIVSRMRANKRSRFSRSFGSSVLTVTLSKKASTGCRNRANCRPSPHRNALCAKASLGAIPLTAVRRSKSAVSSRADECRAASTGSS